MLRFSKAAAALVVGILMPAFLHAQQAADPTTDAQAYLARATASMLQRVTGDPPFKLKASFTASGTPESTGTGTYEEVWVSPEKWRQEITFGSYHAIFVRKGNVTYRLTPALYRPRAVSALEDWLLPDMSPRQQIGSQEKKEPQLQQMNIGGIDVVRIGERNLPGPTIPMPDNARYFSADRGVLMMWTSSYATVSYTSSGKLGDKLALLNFQVVESGKTTLAVRVDSLISNPPIDEAIFTVPDSAHITDQRPKTENPAVAAGKRISGRDPVYPYAAKLQGARGTVVLSVVIDEQGVVREVFVADSSPEVGLNQSAVDAIRTWRFQPTLVDGEPTQVTSEIHINFTMSR